MYDHVLADRARLAIDQMQKVLSQSLFGLEEATEKIIITFLAGGHVLLEDVPGVGKTALAKAIAQFLGLTFRRVQCTPDMLPADITGGLIYDRQTGAFSFREGPIFTNFLLVDEINRALPRTQSALLEAMAEKQVTVDGQTYSLPDPFFVIATQNPIESQGVFPLPEAQLDRFMIKTSLGYPTRDQDLLLLQRYFHGDQIAMDGSASDQDWHLTLKQAYEQVQATEEVLRYMAEIVEATRDHDAIVLGASPRAMIMLARATRAVAVIRGRNYITPDDVVAIAPYVLAHRLVYQEDEDQHDGYHEQIASLLRTIEVPIDRPRR